MVHVTILNYKPPARDFVCSTIHTWVTALFDDRIRFTLMLSSVIFKWFFLWPLKMILGNIFLFLVTKTKFLVEIRGPRAVSLSSYLHFLFLFFRQICWSVSQTRLLTSACCPTCCPVSGSIPLPHECRDLSVLTALSPAPAPVLGTYETLRRSLLNRRGRREG